MGITVKKTKPKWHFDVGKSQSHSLASFPESPAHKSIIIIFQFLKLRDDTDSNCISSAAKNIIIDEGMNQIICLAVSPNEWMNHVLIWFGATLCVLVRSFVGAYMGQSLRSWVGVAAFCGRVLTRLIDGDWYAIRIVLLSKIGSKSQIVLSMECGGMR